MAAMITDPDLESRLIAERQLSGGDRFDEVWEGTYIKASPLADIEHQRLQFYAWPMPFSPHSASRAPL